LNLAVCFALPLGLALVTQCRAEDYYIYHDPDGKLVISNKEPPPGSKIIKQHSFPEVTDAKPHKTKPGKTRPNVQTEGSPKSFKNK
jgi:hypothetical protein